MVFVFLSDPWKYSRPKLAAFVNLGSIVISLPQPKQPKPAWCYTHIHNETHRPPPQSEQVRQTWCTTPHPPYHQTSHQPRQASSTQRSTSQVSHPKHMPSTRMRLWSERKVKHLFEFLRMDNFCFVGLETFPDHYCNLSRYVAVCRLIKLEGGDFHGWDQSINWQNYCQNIRRAKLTAFSGVNSVKGDVTLFLSQPVQLPKQRTLQGCQICWW